MPRRAHGSMMNPSMKFGKSPLVPGEEESKSYNPRGPVSSNKTLGTRRYVSPQHRRVSNPPAPVSLGKTTDVIANQVGSPEEEEKDTVGALEKPAEKAKPTPAQKSKQKPANNQPRRMTVQI